MKEIKNELIICIVNSGYSDTVMNVARSVGVTGGTVLQATGTAKEETEKLFQIKIHPEKEILLMLVDSKITDNVLHALYNEVGLSTPGQGIAFSLPVSHVVGISPINNLIKEKLDDKDA